MRLVLQIISWIALAMTVLPSIVYFSGNMELERVKWLLILATVVWFVVTPFWMGKKEQS
jgi:hypothetical protein